MPQSSDPIDVVDVDLRADLELVEQTLRDAVDSSDPFVHEAASHLLEAGGKRFRPMLVLLSGHLGDAKDPRLIPCAAAIELTHLATLYHDDVIDEALVRRGAPSANVRFDNSVAILTGDYLFARSSSLAADLGSYVSRVLADTIGLLCEGQIMETDHAGTDRQTVERYLAVVERKTAALLATSCRLGAWLAGVPEEQVEAVAEFGRSVGVAFQLSDDVLDITGREEESGKTPGTDLREGVWTLPVLETFAGRVPGGQQLRSRLSAGEVEAALELLRTNGSVDVALGAVSDWASQAKRALGAIPESAGRTALERLADFLIGRTR
ncbi:MAG: polyprenyl synthetase family protein [Actinomycetota bacterium]